MTQNQEKTNRVRKGGRQGGNATPHTTVRLREDERAAVAQQMVAHNLSFVDAIRRAVLETTLRDAEDALKGPVGRVEGIVGTILHEDYEAAKRIGKLFGHIDKQTEHTDELVAALSTRLESLEQGMRLVVACVVGAGMVNRAQRDEWLQQFGIASELYAKGQLGTQLGALVEKASAKAAAKAANASVEG